MDQFRFNFRDSDEEDYLVSANEPKAEGDKFEAGYVSAVVKDNEAEEVAWIPPEKQLNIESMPRKYSIFGHHKLETVATAAVEEKLLQQTAADSHKVIQAIAGHSDLVAGQYEGGLKLWECSLDLCEYLSGSEITVQGAKVLELGCGGGLPGILAAKMGAASVHFQDFNKEVLEMYTMINIHLNHIESSSCAFFAGDWHSFASLACKAGSRYDLILTSETIYNIDSYPKLLTVFSLLLTTSGCILVAAKCDYFGVGGSVQGFIQYVKSNSQFDVKTVHHIDTGVPRKIMILKRPQ